MDRGFITLHRKLLDNPIMQNAELLQLFIYLLLRANHKETKFIWNDKEQILRRGEVLTGRKSLATELKTSEFKVFRKIHILESIGLITVKSHNRFSIISIVKYSFYQDKKLKLHNRCTTDAQQMHTYNNVNNDNNVNNKERGAHSHFVKPTLKELIEYFKNEIEGNKFFNYYESNGWRVGKAPGYPMKDWKAAVRSWKQRSKEFGQPNVANNSPYNFKRCPKCNNHLTSDGTCYHCPSNQINEQIKNILEN